MVLKNTSLGDVDDEIEGIDEGNSVSDMSDSFDSSTDDSDDDSDMESDNASNDDEDGGNDEGYEKIEDDEDELVKAIKEAKEKVSDHPPDLNIDEDIVDICFHPQKDLLAIGTYDGDVLIYSYSNEGNQRITKHELHSKVCRSIEFSANGELLYSASKDKSIMITDMESGKLKNFYDKAHEVPISLVKGISENTFVTGDDDGVVKMWDSRQRTDTSIFSIKLCVDYVSDMVTNSACKYLVCSSGDGALGTINMNARKIHVQSEEYEAEFTCLGLFKNETKILAGSTKGKMYLFNWGEFGLHSDEYPGLKQSTSCMVPVTENIAVFSGEDGILRAMHLFPHKHLGVVGQHTMYVDRIDISNNGNYLASYSYNNDIKFWNVTYFEELEVQTKKQNKRKDLKNNLPSSKIGNASDFFSGMC